MNANFNKGKVVETRGGEIQYHVLVRYDRAQIEALKEGRLIEKRTDEPFSRVAETYTSPITNERYAGQALPNELARLATKACMSEG